MMNANNNAKRGELNYKDDICPLSGIGKPPSEWSHCVVECSLYDATTALCSIHALWLTREIVHELHGMAGDIHEMASDVHDAATDIGTICEMME